MGYWLDDLVNEKKEEILKRELNDFKNIRLKVKDVFSEIEEKFQGVKLSGMPILTVNTDDIMNGYWLNLNTLNEGNNTRSIRCRMANIGGVASMEIEVIVREVFNDITKVASIRTGDLKPKIIYSSQAVSLNIRDREEDFSYINFNWLINKVLNYKENELAYPHRVKL